MANHALAQGVEQNVGRVAAPNAAGVRWLDIDGEEVLVGEGVQAQEVELPLEVGNVSTHRCPRHTPPVQAAA